jgi:hypothetical protein
MDFETLKVNELDPDLNKVVKIIVIQHRDFIVYLDGELDTQWHVREEVGDPVRFGKVLNAVSSVELRSDFLREDERTFMRIRQLAGEAIARAIDDRDEKTAMNAIQHAEAIIAKRSAELSRRWYYRAAQNLVVALVLFAAIAWLTRNVVPWDALIGRAAFEFIFCAVSGAVGALVSITIRSHSIELDAMSGQLAHRMESRARILTGMVAAIARNKTWLDFSVSRGPGINQFSHASRISRWGKRTSCSEFFKSVRPLGCTSPETGRRGPERPNAR